MTGGKEGPGSKEDMKVRDVLKLIEDDGWYQVTQKGSHRQFKHPNKTGRVTIADIPLRKWTKGPSTVS